MKPSTRMWPIVGLLVALSLALSTLAVQAQEETASAGNAGTADCAANGGAAALGDVNAGLNLGSTIGVGDSWGDVSAGGGAIANTTDGTIGVDGGTGICDGSGGDANLGLNIEPPPAPGPDRDNDNDRDRDRDRDRDDPDEPIEEFQVCVAIPGADVVCGAGECEGPDEDASCTLEDCSDLPSVDSPCSFSGCEVQGNTGNCVLPVPTVASR